MSSRKIVYVAPSYESVQHEVTKSDDKGTPLETSLHTDVSLLMRIDKLHADANLISQLKQALQPMIDSSNMRAQFEDSFGKLTDKQLIESCPSRYVQTLSEQKTVLSNLCKQQKEEAEKARKDAEDKEAAERDVKEKEDFDKSISELLKRL